MSTIPLQAFAAFGIELEYILVDKTSLDIRPIADVVLAQAQCAENPTALDYSNELALHVIEIKNTRPGPLPELASAFHVEVQRLNSYLEPHNACLMPTAMHPWMDPTRETALWPHDDQGIYSTYHRLFNCKRHSWANVQSMHVNLPFADDQQFEKLLAAVRVLLPILPAIAASSPVADGALSGYLDYRMHVYRDQSPTQPRIVGGVVPEIVRTQAEQEAQVLAPMYADIAAIDPANNLRFEWLNSRGAIPRFDRSAIEIRVMDMQECPQADLALAALVVDLTQLLYDGEVATLQAQQALSTLALREILFACNRDAEQTVIDDVEYLSAFGFRGHRCTAQELWYHLSETLLTRGAHHIRVWQSHLQFVLQHGTLARRIIRALAGDVSRPALHSVYARLAKGLGEGTPFLA